MVELGTGTGQFSYYLLKALFELKETWGDSVENINFCYVMTDFTENNIDYWKQHAALRPFIDRGCLDFAVFDTEADTYIKLLKNNVTISAQSLHTPLVVIANYLFDSVFIDVFHIENKAINETQVKLELDDIAAGK